MNEPRILDEAFSKIKDYFSKNSNLRNTIHYQTPTELSKILDLPVSKDGVSEKDFLSLLDKYLEYSVRTGNKQFLNQLYSGFNFPAFLGEVFATLASTSMATYEIAPAATLIEMEMIGTMCNYAGYKNGDGIFVTGGSNANMLALLSARNKYSSDSKTKGYDRNLKLKVFVNEDAHYSLITAANIVGIGAENVVKIKTDKEGRLILQELDQAIVNCLAKGEKPFFVAATCGTTVRGAFDSIEDIEPICKKYNLWLHADGSMGGSLLLSSKYRHFLKGIEKTDSFAWNPHKLMNIPLVCSVLLTRENKVLANNLANINTDYIYHNSEGDMDLGEKSLQCGRRADAVKLWFAWKYFGLDGYQKRIDNLITLATYAEEKVVENAKLKMTSPRQSISICFIYLPKKGIDQHEFNLKLREQMRTDGKAMVNFAFINEELIFRLVITNGEMEKVDIDRFFDILVETAVKLEMNYTDVSNA